MAKASLPKPCPTSSIASIERIQHAVVYHILLLGAAWASLSQRSSSKRKEEQSQSLVSQVKALLSLFGYRRHRHHLIFRTFEFYSVQRFLHLSHHGKAGNTCQYSPCEHS